jgi:hypothetical protein
MKLSELTPCAKCGKPLLDCGAGSWFVVKASVAMLHPIHARESIAMAALMGNLMLSEVMGPSADKAVVVFGDDCGWSQWHLCASCYGTMGFEELVSRKEESVVSEHGGS